MQPIRLNTSKKFKEINKEKIGTSSVISDLIELKEGVSLPDLEPLTQFNEKVGSSEKPKKLFEQKIAGAISEIFRHKELDEGIEKSLSEGLEKNEEFAKADQKINKRRNWFAERVSSLIKKNKNETQDNNYVFDESGEVAMKQLEQELEDNFTRKIYNRLGKINKNVLLEHLADNPASLGEVKIIDLPTVSDAYENVVVFTDNGYLMQMSNKEEVRNDDGIVIDSEAAKYNLINPDGSVLSQNLNYREALEYLKQEATKYHEGLVAEFTPPKNIKNSLLEQAEPDKVNEEEMLQKEKEANEIMDKILDDQKAIESQKLEEEEFFNHFSGKKSGPQDEAIGNEDVDSSKVGSEVDEFKVSLNHNTEQIHVESLDDDEEDFEIRQVNFDDPESGEASSNPFSDEVFLYAEKMGIKPEELANNRDFVSLNPAEQRFILDTLRRSSLSRVKVLANENFNQERASKKWWQLGFAFNQNYHKERHQNEALQSIEKRGLEGYGGHQELEYLIDVVKNGPEVKINEQGDLKIDYLRPDNFSSEELERVEDFNRLAEKYIRLSSDQKDKKNTEYLLGEMKEIVNSFIRNADGIDKYTELCEIFRKTKNSIDLVKFLSGDPETETLLDNMSQASSGGKLEAIWGMIKGQKDKLGYAGLGFTLRTGAKFVLANAATLSAAISYSVAPLAAAAVGAFRGYSSGKKEIAEKEDLSRLGVEDKSGLTKSLNVASGVRTGQYSEKEVVFGLAEKLQNLTDKLQSAKESGDLDLFNKLESDLYKRVIYTEDKMARNSVSYGLAGDRKINYFNLVNSLSEAKLLLGLSNFSLPKKMYYQDTSSLYSSENLELIRKENRNFNYRQQEGESKEDYEERIAVHKEELISRLEKFDVEQRLSVFLNYQANKQNKKERTFLIKKISKGALMGAGFAAAGAFLADKIGLDALFSKSSVEDVVDRGTDNPEEIAYVNSEGDVVTPPAIAENSVAENIAVSDEVVTKEVEHVNMEANTSKYSDTISSKELSGKSDSIWRSAREIFKRNAVDLGYKGDLDDARAIHNWAEAQTAAAVNNSEGMSRVVFEGNKVELIRDGDGFRISLEKGDGIEPKEIDIPVDHSEYLEDIKIDRPELKQEITHEINTRTIREQLTSRDDISTENINDSSAKLAIRLVKGGGVAHNISGETYSGGFKNTEEFLNRLNSLNKELGIELSDAQRTEAGGIWDSFKSHNDYNILRRSLDDFESKVVSGAEFSVENTISAPSDTSIQGETPVVKIGDLENISKELNLKPENLSQEGGSLVYEKGGLGKVFLGADGKSISKVIAPDNQEIPQDFVKDVLGRKDLGRFTKQGGLDKILNNWNKLDSNDQLTLRTIDWINKSPEKWPPSEIFTQLKAIFKINTDNLIYDSAGKQILIKGDTRAFSMTLKGLKEMTKYLNK